MARGRENEWDTVIRVREVEVVEFGLGRVVGGMVMVGIVNSGVDTVSS